MLSSNIKYIVENTTLDHTQDTCLLSTTAVGEDLVITLPSGADYDGKEYTLVFVQDDHHARVICALPTTIGWTSDNSIPLTNPGDFITLQYVAEYDQWHVKAFGNSPH